jgi:hypothetical protein
LRNKAESIFVILDYWCPSQCPESGSQVRLEPVPIARNDMLIKPLCGSIKKEGYPILVSSHEGAGIESIRSYTNRGEPEVENTHSHTSSAGSEIGPTKYQTATLVDPMFSGTQNLHPSTVIVAVAALPFLDKQNNPKPCRVYETLGVYFVLADSVKCLEFVLGWKTDWLIGYGILRPGTNRIL